MSTRKITLTEEQGDTLLSALHAAGENKGTTRAERAALRQLADTFRRHDVTITVAGVPEDYYDT